MSKVSCLIICRNEEKNIEECIKSIQWCDEIVIVDSYSTDNTIPIAKNYTDKIFQREWKGFSEQRKIALTLAEHDWIFAIDADERCTTELQREIKDVLNSKVTTNNGFEIPRKSFFLGKWIKHGGWYPNYQLRLFKKDQAAVSERLVHESYVVKGTTGKLKSDILHYTVSSISEYVTKINTYSDLSALEKLNKKKINFLDILLTPCIAFFQQYILKGNFLDGTEGLMVARFHMTTKMLNNMKIRELQKKINNKV